MKLLYGSSGPFVPTSVPSGRITGSVSAAAGKANNLAPVVELEGDETPTLESSEFDNGSEGEAFSEEVVSGEIWVTGYFKYNDLDLSPPNNLSPIPGTIISALCVGHSSPYTEEFDLVLPVQSHTGSNGYFSVNCPEPEGDGVWSYIDGTAFLRDSDVDVTTPGGGIGV
jgi:hypothetical protein